nr:hypothetical protein [Streptomyces canus]
MSPTACRASLRTAPIPATVTSTMPALWAHEGCSARSAKPTTVPMAGSRLIRVPKTGVGRLRRATISAAYGRIGSSSAARADRAKACGSM